ncbi:MAG: hypothetical protein HRT88_15070, partial [Lentisphaeraceae bacterium]|nr:hypothetical protein [Lentisphaeraceae bacterium]
TGEQKEHDYLYWEFNEIKGPIQALRLGKWKFIRSWDTKKKAMGSLRMYDLEVDKGEKKNLASKYPERIEKALKKLQEVRSENENIPLVKKVRKGKKKGIGKSKKK